MESADTTACWQRTQGSVCPDPFQKTGPYLQQGEGRGPVKVPHVQKLRLLALDTLY